MLKFLPLADAVHLEMLLSASFPELQFRPAAPDAGHHFPRLY
jgi:hypothetical protein